jgi:hypothetical protein
MIATSINCGSVFAGIVLLVLVRGSNSEGEARDGE